MNLTDLTIAQAHKALKNKETCATELTQAYLNNMQKNKNLNAYITETPEQALKMAQQAEQKIKNNDAGKLCGIPIAVKDAFCTENIKTTAASNILNNFIPPYESTVTKKLWNENAILLGKTNMDEFAMGSTNENSFFGPCINPCKSTEQPNQDFTPGGSSGGSAAAVAAHIAAAAIGTDTGGSIRQPASFCGVTGIKPTYGRCSRYGIIAFASSLDQAGVLTKDTADAAIMLSAMCGYDEKDSTSANIPDEDFTQAIGKSIRGKKIGIPKEFQNEEINQETLIAWNKTADILKQAGAEIIEISLPMAEHALAAYYVIAPAEASSNLARYDGVRYGLRIEGEDLIDMYSRTRAEGFGDEVKRRIIIGTYALSVGYYDAYYKQAQKVRRLISQDFDSAFEKCDIILTPTTPHTATALGNKSEDALQDYWLDIYTVPVSMAGLPALSLPVGRAFNNLPLGSQLIGRSFAEAEIFSVAHIIEEACDGSL